MVQLAERDPRHFEYRPVRRKKDLPIDEVDDAEVATQAAREAGISIYCYVNMYDEGMPPHVDNYTHGRYPWESTFFREHPDYYACDRDWQKRHWGVPEYAYTEVREYKLRELAHLVDRYEWDGVYVATRGHRMPAEHGDQYGFNRPVAEAFWQRHGVDILTQNFDLEAWRRLRGEFVTEYLREVRKFCDRRGLGLGMGVPPGDYFGPPVGNLHLDWRTWVRERLLDFIVPGHANVVGSHLRMGYGYLTSYFEGELGQRPLPELLADEYGPLCREHGGRPVGEPDDQRAAGQGLRQEVHQRDAQVDSRSQWPVLELGEQGRPHAHRRSVRGRDALAFGPGRSVNPMGAPARRRCLPRGVTGG